ncbi:MAG: hypothetical protein H6741_30565 [Alphaproteobacteria bacterium]|nr:hypothetical protein [Alphaproteobacteria bacterium]
MDNEAPARFSRSPIWRTHRAYFDEAGPRAWTEDGLPTQVTTGAMLAEAYAELLVDFAELAARDPEAPVYVVELGAGTGALAARIARALPRLSLPETPRVVYVLTDLAPKNVEAWAQDPLLIELAEKGLVDFAVLDLEAPGPLELRVSGARLEPGGCANPVAWIANYLLDCVPCDLFHAKEGRLHEVKVSYHWSERAEAWAFTLHPEDAPIPEGYYAEPALQALLETYARELDEAWPLVPAGALAALDRLLELGPGGLLLSADKAYRHLSEWQAAGTPHVVSHGRAISVMANLHAVGALFEHGGGRAWHSASAQSHLTVSAFARGLSEAQLRRLGRSFRRFLDDPGPVDRYRALGLGSDAEEAALRKAIAELRLSAYDPMILLQRVDALLPLASRASPPLRLDLQRALEAIDAREVELGGVPHLPFHVGRVLYTLGAFEAAAQRFERALLEAETAPIACYNLHVCASKLDRPEEARRWLRRALELDPEMEMAKKKLAELEAESSGVTH